MSSVSVANVDPVTANPHPHSHAHDHSHAQTNGQNKPNGTPANGLTSRSPEFETLHMFLQSHFGDVSAPSTGDDDDLWVMDVKVDKVTARVDLISMVSGAPLLVIRKGQRISPFPGPAEHS